MSLKSLIQSPKQSPSLGEAGPAILVDTLGVRMAIEAVVFPDANGATGVNPLPHSAGSVSQVTAREGSVKVNMPGAGSIPVRALVSLDGSGNPIPFAVPSAASVSGKFQSAVRVATGAAENIAHGLGVAPSLVLVSVYDDTNAGVLASGYVVTEGAHDATNVKVTVTANAKYKVIAFA